MTLSLYDATVPPYLQTLGAIQALLVKAESYCEEKRLRHQELTQARLASDMHPFTYQVKSTVVHSLGALESVRRGSFSPDNSEPPESFAALKASISAAIGALAALSADEVNGFTGRPMRYVSPNRQMDFTAENFLLSFSLPNFYFHATTAYDILRWKELPIGKKDFLGKIRVKS